VKTTAPVGIGPQQPPRRSLRSLWYGCLTESLSRILRSPQYLILFVSDRCWMRCAHCWFHEAWKEREVTRPPLTFDEYERLARSVPSLAFLSLTGGEAFLRPDIVELATMFRKTTRLGRYQIPTSGYETDTVVRAAEVLLRANSDTPFRIDVSLDGVGEVHDGQRRMPGGFDRAVATIEALNQLRRRHTHFDLGIITTITALNQSGLDETAALVERIHPDGEWMVNIARGESREPDAVAVDPESYRLAQNLIRDRDRRGGYCGHSGHRSARWLTAKNAARREIIGEILAGGRFRGGCAAGSLGGVIQTDGTVKICELLDEPLGKLRDFDCDLVRLWQSEAARRMRRRIQETRCQCTQECFLSVSMLISPDAWRRMLAHRWEMDRFGLVRHGPGPAPTEPFPAAAESPAAGSTGGPPTASSGSRPGGRRRPGG
jgi:MoaA/NifB/PqqE/SkfB family radical SAM enzyme